VSTENGCEVIAAKLSRVGDIAVIDDAICFRATIAGSYPRGTPVYPSADDTFDQASIPTEIQIAGVLAEDSTAGQVAWIAFGGVTDVLVTGPTFGAGALLFMSGVAGRARFAPFTSPGIFAVAVTSKPALGPGVVRMAFKAGEVF